MSFQTPQPVYRPLPTSSQFVASHPVYPAGVFPLAQPNFPTWQQPCYQPMYAQQMHYQPQCYYPAQQFQYPAQVYYQPQSFLPQFDNNGFDCDGFDCEGFDCEGYDYDGFDRNGFDYDGYDRNGFDYDGFDRNGYNSRGFNCNGYDCNGYNSRGFNCNGYDCDGYNRSGFNSNGYDCDGYNRKGFNSDGYDCEGYNRKGFNSSGYNRDGYDCEGYDIHGSHFFDGYSKTGTPAQRTSDLATTGTTSTFTGPVMFSMAQLEELSEFHIGKFYHHSMLAFVRSVVDGRFADALIHMENIVNARGVSLARFGDKADEKHIEYLESCKEQLRLLRIFNGTDKTGRFVLHDYRFIKEASSANIIVPKKFRPNRNRNNGPEVTAAAKPAIAPKKLDSVNLWPTLG